MDRAIEEIVIRIELQRKRVGRLVIAIGKALVPLLFFLPHEQNIDSGTFIVMLLRKGELEGGMEEGQRGCGIY